MNTDPLLTIKTPLFITKWSFIIGTVILMAHFASGFFIPHNTIMVISGFFYVVAAVVINIIVFLVTIIASFWHIEHQNEMIMNAIVQLVNIPIAVFYFYLVTSFHF
jgi:hypothetical protein